MKLITDKTALHEVIEKINGACKLETQEKTSTRITQIRITSQRNDTNTEFIEAFVGVYTQYLKNNEAITKHINKPFFQYTDPEWQSEQGIFEDLMLFKGNLQATFRDEQIEDAKSRGLYKTGFKGRFREYYKQHKQELPTSNKFDKDGTGRLSIQNMKHVLETLGIFARFNVISHKPEFEGEIFYEYNGSNISSICPTVIHDNVADYLTKCDEEKVRNVLNVILAETCNQYNPILEKINSVTWDKVDRLEQAYSLLNITSDKLSQILFKKWCMQCYCGLHNNINNPFSLDIVLVLLGSQGYGKTSFFRKLSLGNFDEGRSIDTSDKDSIIEATSCWITELGEIGSTMKKDRDKLKAFLSRATDRYRAPYGRTTVEYPRTTSFCGTCNDSKFLIDDTGNRRFATIPIPRNTRIDVNGDLFKNFDSLQFWAQIKEITETEIKEKKLTYSSVFRLNGEELTKSEARNGEYMKPLKGEEEVSDIISWLITPETDYDLTTRKLTATQFKSEHDELKNYSSQQICKILEKMGFDKSERTKFGYLWEIPTKTHKSISNIY